MVCNHLIFNPNSFAPNTERDHAALLIKSQFNNGFNLTIFAFTEISLLIKYGIYFTNGQVLWIVKIVPEAIIGQSIFCGTPVL